MNTRLFAIAALSFALISTGSLNPAWAQQGPDDSKPAEGTEKAEDKAEPASDAEKDVQAAPAESTTTPETPQPDAKADTASEEVEAEPVEEEDDVVEEDPVEEEPTADDSPIADLATEDFEPLEDIEEGTLEQIIPADVYPRLEWHGDFRVRSSAAINWDLDTQGTSAIMPPLESVTAAATPNRDNRPLADGEKETLWSTNMRLRLDPSIHISEMLEAHIELDIFDNVVFGSLPESRDGSDASRAELYNSLAAGNQLSPTERAWYEDTVRFNEVYGIARSPFGELRAGRMDDHWGLGMWMNDGDCLDCDYGNNVDRLMLRTGLFGFYASASIDFPDEGLSTQSPGRVGGQPYDVAQIDDADQWTFTILSRPETREELELQKKKLQDDGALVPNGGLLYRYRSQSGFFQTDTFDNAQSPVDPQNPPNLAYRGMRLHVFDLWGQLLYEPSPDLTMRIEIEGLLGFGSIDNPTDLSVGGANEDDLDAINCFDEGVRSANTDRCLDGEDDITQYALALESEFRLKNKISFGLNGGFASGGSTQNWGAGGNDNDFFRFNPDYHVDLMLFRNVIGTVTNAVYYNPYVQASFLQNGNRQLRVDFDAILAHAWDKNGTPNGDEPLLGLEFDAALRWIQLDMFHAAFEAGILFPFGGFEGQEGDSKLTPIDGTTFDEDTDPGVAWTAQFKFFWTF